MNSKKIIFKVTISKDKTKKPFRHNKQKTNFYSVSTTVFNSKLQVEKSIPNKNILNIINRQIPCLKLTNKKLKSPEEVLERRTLNPFFAFRIYYSQFYQGVDQKQLSTLLAREWKKDHDEQQFWNNLTEQYKQIKDI